MKRNSERIALIVVALLTVAIMSITIYFERQLSNQKAMFYQLQALRTSINLFKAVNGRNPEDLAEMISSEYKFPGEDIPRRFFHNLTLNKAGAIIDPFETPYQYDKVTGWVRSASAGYEYW
ncbi:MAG TPA: hypothetical protein PKU96_04450 [bacterium]|nr:hypothetical protein [Myxococcales bacterium]OQA61906.1 MAG: hypothetical protein BWY40_00377 [bacterium ADurb.Bin270]HPW45603.1 hypothetical protein [bacterium]HQG13626.1 hypothetical protein [bacterium]